MPPSTDVTALLRDWSRGNQGALNRLLPFVYAAQRRIATRQLRRERIGDTLQAAALVHEEAGCVVDVSPSTAKREKRTAKARLARELALDSHT